MLDGRYDPAFALYFTEKGDDVSVDLPTGAVILGVIAAAFALLFL